MLHRQALGERAGENLTQGVADGGQLHRRAATDRDRGQARLLHVLKGQAPVGAGASEGGDVHAIRLRKSAGSRADIRIVGDGDLLCRCWFRFRRSGRWRGGTSLGRDLGVGGLEPGDKGIDLVSADLIVRSRQHGDQFAHGISVALLGDEAREHSVGLGLDLIGDLVGFDEGEQVALLERHAFGDHPFGNDAFGHFYAPFGHRICAQSGHDMLIPADRIGAAPPPPRSCRARADRRIQVPVRTARGCAAASPSRSGL